VTEPLAILFYERLIPGSQLVNRLQDLGYRVQTLNDADLLQAQAEQAKPLILLVDLFSRHNTVLPALIRLREHPVTSHIPVLAFSGEADPAALEAARQAGATLVVTDAAITHHLPQLLSQALTEF
jgi:CheY-like chemotaxis protein